MNINELLDRFEILYPMNERIELLRRAYVDQDLSSIFKLASPSEELRKAVMEENMHSIFRLIAEQNTNTVPIEDLRKAVVEDNLHSIFRILAELPSFDIEIEDLRKAMVEKNLHSIFRLIADTVLKEGTVEDLRKAVVENNLRSLFRLVDVSEDLRKAVVEKNIHSIFRLVEVDEDLRKAIVEKNLHSIFRLLEIDEDIKKILINDNMWSLWKVLGNETNSPFVAPFKHFYAFDIPYDKDVFSQGQLQSKIWLVNQLKKLNIDLGVVFICAGWYATLATMIFDSGITVEKIRSFDIDSTCIDIAETFNKPWVADKWRFKSITQNIMDINYEKHHWEAWSNSNNRISKITDTPTTIINTSCEHIENFSEWYSLIPADKLVILQTNNYFEIEDHVNCSASLEDFKQQTPMNHCLYEGVLELPKYTRYMRIGYR
jgi:hypothetical protein